MFSKLINFKKPILKRLLSYNLISFSKEKNAIRWGIVGLGYMAHEFGYSIRCSKNSVISAVASRSIAKAKKFAEKHGKCHAFGSYDELITDNANMIDVLYISTPLSVHYKLIKKAISNNINVLCEKPIVETPEEFEELIVLAKEKNVFFMEGMWMKCLPTIQRAIEKIKNDQIGKVNYIKVNFNKMLNIENYHLKYSKDKFGGVLFDYGIYAISFIHLFLGDEPQIIEKELEKSKHGYDTKWKIVLKKNNITGVAEISSKSNSKSCAYIIGDNGSIKFESQFNRTNKLEVFDSVGKIKEKYYFKYTNQGFEFQINEVVNCIRSGKKESNLVSLKDSLETLKILKSIKF